MLPPIPSPPPGVAIANDTSTSSVRYPVFAAVVSGQVIKEYVSSSKLYYVPSTGVLNATSFAGAGTGLTGTAASLSIGGNAATATLATAATNLAGGVANNMAYQTGAGATAFITAPSTSGSYLQWTSVGGFAWTPFSGVTSFSAGTTGFTPNVSTTGAITLAGTLGAANGGTGATTLTGYVYGNGVGVMTASATIPNTAVSGLGSMSTQNANNVAITGGSINGATIGGSVAAAGSFTTLGGTTITASTQFTGPGTGLTGTAASLSIGGTAALATSLAAGSTYSIPYQSAAGTTAFLAAGTSGSILMTLGSFSAPIWTSAAALSVASANNLVGGNSGYVPYQSAASTTAFVSAGTTGQVFTSGGTGSPTWTSQSALSVGIATNIAGGGAYYVPYQTTAGITAFLAPGTAGQVFTTNGSGSAPTWTSPSSVYTRTQQTAASGQTTFTVSYTVGYIWVHRNGVFLDPTDYTASNGTSVVFASGLIAGDLIDFVVFAPFSLAAATGSGLVVLATGPTVTNPILGGATSGGVTLAVPAVAGSNTATLPAATGTVMVSGNMPAFSASNGSSYAISNTTFIKTQNNTKQFDTANAYDATTNYRFTPQVAGYYQINGFVSFQSGTSGVGLISIYKNGSRTLDGNQIPFTASAPPKLIISYVLYMNGTSDYLELYAYQSSGGTINIDSSYFNGALVRVA